MSRQIFALCSLVLILGALPASATNLLVDQTFGPNAGHFRYNRDSSSEVVYDAAVDSQGRILLATLLDDGSGTYWPTIYRLKADGYADTTFGFLGVWMEQTIDAALDCGVTIAVDSSDRPIIGWTNEFYQLSIQNRDWYIRRLTTSGGLDDAQVVAFDIGINNSGDRLDELNDLRVMPDGRIVGVGSAQWDDIDWDMAVAVIEDDGSGNLQLDTSFHTDGRRTVAFDLAGGSKYDNADEVIIDNTGNIVLIGWSHASGGNQIAISRIDKDTGNLDTTFNSTGKATYIHKPLIADPELPARGVAGSLRGSGIVVGAIVTDAPFDKIGILALLSDGSVDYSFATNGWYTSMPGYPGTIFTDTSSGISGLVTDDDRIVYSGHVDDPNDFNQYQGIVGVLALDGSPYSDFTSGGYDFYTFEPGGEQTATSFSAVLIPEYSIIGVPVGKVVLAGWMRGVTSGGSRSDLDLMATKVYTDQSPIFSDDFESNSLTAWSGSSE